MLIFIMMILAEGLYLVNSTFIHVNYTSAQTTSEEFDIAVMAVVGSILLIGWVITIFYAIKKIRRNGKMDSEDDPG